MKIPQTQTRSLSLVFESVDDDDRLMNFSFSSEYPADRSWGTEILEHNPNSANFERIKSLQFLWNHDQDKVLGKVMDAYIGADRRGHCQIKWSGREETQKYRQDVIDGILENISFCYTIDKVVERDKKFYVTEWTPLEISLVSVPVDFTVGIGRSIDFINPSSETTVEVETDGQIRSHKVPRSRTMKTTTSETPEQEDLDLEKVRSEAVTLERDRITAINALCDTHNRPELAPDLIRENRSLDYVRSKILDEIKNNPQQPVAQTPANPLGLRNKEQKQYSLLRAIEAAASGDWSKAGFERECSVELAKRSGLGAPKGFLMPVRDLNVGQRAPYQTGVPTFGGNTVETELMSQNFIDLLRNKSMVMKLGATMLSGMQGNVAIPTATGAATAYWVAENGAITQSEGTFGQLAATPKTIAARSQWSRQMIQQSSVDIEQFIRRDFAQIIALGIDLAAIAGTGTGNQPRGILNTPGIGSVALGANGGQPTWQSIIQLETEIAQDNADLGSMAYLTNAKARGKLKGTLKNPTGVSEYIWQDTNISNGVGAMNGYKAASSNQISSTLAKGTGTNLSAIIFGCWNQIICFEWGVLDLLVNPFGAGYNSGAVDIRAMQTVDILTRYAEAFSAITDCITV
jgi:HK97 family phage major capsid protein